MKRSLSALAAALFLAAAWVPAVESCPEGKCDPAKCAKMHQEGEQQHKCPGARAAEAAANEDPEGKCDPANCAKMHQEGEQQHKCPGARAAEAAANENLVVDPICGMKIDKGEAAAQVEYEGRTYYFCRLEGKETFLSDPDKYLAER